MNVFEEWMLGKKNKGDMRKTNKETLSQLVERTIKQNRLKLKEVERRSGGKITSSHISKILSGEAANLTAEKIIALAAGLGLSPMETFSTICGESSNYEAEIVDARIVLDTMQKLVVNPRLMEILRLAERLTDKRQELLISSMRHLNELGESKKGSRRTKKN
jgi:transcriptional regulator with XRE-family HTH domain